MSRTLTSRTTNVPDWLQTIRRAPGYPAMQEKSPSDMMFPVDVEGGRRNESEAPSSPVEIEKVPARDADIEVIPRHTAEQLATEPLGVAAMLKELEQHSPTAGRSEYVVAADTSSSGAATEVGSSSALDPLTAMLTHDVDQHDQGDASRGDHESEDKINMATIRVLTNDIPRPTPVNDEEGGEPGSGVQTPIRTVHFPPSQ